jgi:hypothetical protein
MPCAVELAKQAEQSSQKSVVNVYDSSMGTYSEVKTPPPPTTPALPNPPSPFGATK